MKNDTNVDTEKTVFNNDELISPEQRKNIKNAQIALYVVAGMVLLGGVVSSFKVPSSSIVDVWIEVIAIAGLFLVLSLVAEKKPFIAILIGFTVFILYYLFYFFINPESILRGIVFKIVVVIYLGRGLVNAYEVKKMNDVLNK